MLTLALVENLRRLADEILRSRRARTVADDYLEHAETDAADGLAGRRSSVASIVQLLLRTREYGRADAAAAAVCSRPISTSGT